MLVKFSVYQHSSSGQLVAFGWTMEKNGGLREVVVPAETVFIEYDPQIAYAENSPRQ